MLRRKIVAPCNTTPPRIEGPLSQARMDDSCCTESGATLLSNWNIDVSWNPRATNMQALIELDL